MEQQIRAWIRRVCAVFGVAAFVLFLWAPLLGLVTGLGVDEGSGENRRLAAPPALPESLDRVGAWRHELEQYFDDHFGFRNELVRLHNGLAYHVLDESGSKRVFLGRDGWMFLAAENGLENYRRTLEPWTRSEMRALCARIEARRDYLARYGVEYLYVVAPAKSTIYPEFIEPRLHGRDRPSRLEQFREFAKSRPDLPFVDLTESLLREKERLATAEPGTLLYYKTDTHWNPRGASFAADELRRLLRGRGIDVPPPSGHSRAAWRSERSPTGGDLARMLGLEQSLSNTDWHLLDEELGSALTLTPLPAERSSYLVVDPAPSTRTNLVVLHDSFGEMLREFLARGHPRSACFWQPEFDILSIASFAPGLVIREVTERYFVTWEHQNPVVLNELPRELAMQEKRDDCLAASRDLRVDRQLRLHGVELLDHGDNLEIICYFEALAPVVLDGHVHVSCDDEAGRYVAGRYLRLCPLGSTAQPGFRWKQSILLPSRQDGVARIGVSFPRKDESCASLSKDGATLGEWLHLQADQARPSPHLGRWLSTK